VRDAPRAGDEPRDRLELLIERRDASIALLSPGVGLFTRARRQGDVVAGGSEAGALVVLGRAVTLVVPAGVEGRVASPPPRLAREPVGWGDLLYELDPIGTATGADSGTAGGDLAAAARDAASPSAPAELPGGRVLFLAPQSGRFYLRPSPTEDPFVSPGDTVEDGQTVGLVEVMKTFALVRYVAAGPLPPRARLARVLVADGAEVGTGDPLLELEPLPRP